MSFGLRDTLARIFQAEPEAAANTPANQRRSPRRPAHETALVEWQDPEKGTQAVAGRVENSSREGFGIRIPRLIARGKTILVTPEDGAPTKAVVRHCAVSEGGWYIGVELVAHDKRRTDREPMYCAAQVICTLERKRTELSAIILDASDTGVQLEIAEALAPDQVIEVTHLGISREGVVVRCRPSEDGYRIGVQFVRPARRESARQVS